MINTEILQDIYTDHNLCGPQKRELVKTIAMIKQGRLIDGDKLIMSIADWQMTLSPANNEADVFEYNVLESVIEHIAELKELEGEHIADVRKMGKGQRNDSEN